MMWPPAVLILWHWIVSKDKGAEMVRAALPLLLALACLGCAASEPQMASESGCRVGQPGYSDCQNQTDDGFSVHLGATVSETLVRPIR
jgi:hypothetical protein